jgi:hypothetical protein
VSKDLDNADVSKCRAGTGPEWSGVDRLENAGRGKSCPQPFARPPEGRQRIIAKVICIAVRRWLAVDNSGEQQIASHEVVEYRADIPFLAGCR